MVEFWLIITLFFNICFKKRMKETSDTVKKKLKGDVTQLFNVDFKEQRVKVCSCKCLWIQNAVIIFNLVSICITIPQLHKNFPSSTARTLPALSPDYFLWWDGWCCEWGKTVDAIYLNLGKAFHIVFHSVHIVRWWIMSCISGQQEGWKKIGWTVFCTGMEGSEVRERERRCKVLSGSQKCPTTNGLIR